MPSGKQASGAWEKRGCPEAPLLDFYMYRAQTDENYSPVNQDMANIGWWNALFPKAEVFGAKCRWNAVVFAQRDYLASLDSGRLVEWLPLLDEEKEIDG